MDRVKATEMLFLKKKVNSVLDKERKYSQISRYKKIFKKQNKKKTCNYFQSCTGKGDMEQLVTKGKIDGKTARGQQGENTVDEMV